MPCGRPHFEAHVITDSGFLVFVMSLDLRDLSPEEKMSCLALRCGVREAIELGQRVCLESIEAVRVHEGRYSVPLSPSDSPARKHSELWPIRRLASLRMILPLRRVRRRTKMATMRMSRKRPKTTMHGRPTPTTPGCFVPRSSRVNQPNAPRGGGRSIRRSTS